MSTNAKLREIARRLPPVPHPGHQHTPARRMGSGSSIEAAGYKGPVKSNAKYSRPLPFTPADHFKELQKAIRRGGWDEVISYVNGVKDRVPAPQAAQITKRMPWKVRLLLWAKRIYQQIKDKLTANRKT